MRCRDDIIVLAYAIGRDLATAIRLEDDIAIYRFELAFRVLKVILDPTDNSIDIKIARHRYGGSISEMERLVDIYFETLIV